MSSDDNEERALKRLTVRELRQKAVKALGSKMAAGLKLKQELVDALSKKVSARATSAAGAKGAKAKAVAPRPSEAKGATPSKTPSKAAVEAEVGRAERPAPVAARRSKAAAVAAAGELPISRDFFVDPRRPALPTAYGDDRLLCFRREPLAVMVSWDLSAATFGDGQGLSLEIVDPKGRLWGSATIAAATGLSTFEQLPEGKPLTVQVVKKGRVMTRARPFVLGAEVPDEAEPAYQMTVPFDEPLPSSPERQVWADAPKGSRPAGRARRASSSRLSS